MTSLMSYGLTGVQDTLSLHAVAIRFRTPCVIIHLGLYGFAALTATLELGSGLKNRKNQSVELHKAVLTDDASLRVVDISYSIPKLESRKLTRKYIIKIIKNCNNGTASSVNSVMETSLRLH